MLYEVITVAIAEKTGISQTVVGGYFTAVATSIPELVTTIAAVRRGALTLAVGGIVGGNMFDMVFIASRITSYNVCYTKLLRGDYLSPPPPDPR